ncbi:FmdB family zinc ribbon protein, partial [Geodermatophilus chilensis]|uniref:FmdB family zinc ribbon protein n=1 Tax=Geodermatophilus chilensis TaxID=2035835 RepID=UPI000C264895
MPLYEFRCPHCGPFDVHRDMRDAPDSTACPSCDRSARRVYSVGVSRPAGGALRDATRAERARVDRARSGEPVVTGAPSGRRFPSPRGHHHRQAVSSTHL